MGFFSCFDLARYLFNNLDNCIAVSYPVCARTRKWPRDLETLMQNDLVPLNVLGPFDEMGDVSLGLDILPVV